MLRVNYKTTYGVVRVKREDGKVCDVKIHPANCLCAFIQHYVENGQKMSHLFMFLYDQTHIRNIMRNEGKLFPYSDIVSVKLNVFHKEARQLVVPMSQSGYKVQCYYKENKK